MGRRRKQEYSSSDDDEELHEHEGRGRPKAPRKAGPSTHEAGLDPQRKQCRRPVWFWAEFNQWWRESLEHNGKRPNKLTILQWYNTNAATVWEHDTPSYTETRMHAKCLRSTEAVRLYFRRYRAARREHADHTGDDEEHSDGGAAPAPVRARTSVQRAPYVEEEKLDPAALIAEHNRRVSESQAQAQVQAELQLMSGMPKRATVTTFIGAVQQPGTASLPLGGHGRGKHLMVDLGPSLHPVHFGSLRPTWGSAAALGSHTATGVAEDPDGDSGVPLSSIGDSQPISAVQVAPILAAAAPTTALADGGAASSADDASSKIEPGKACTSRGVPPRFPQDVPAKRISEHSTATGDAYGNEGSAAGAGSGQECSGADLDDDGRWAPTQPLLPMNMLDRQLQLYQQQQPLIAPMYARLQHFPQAASPQELPAQHEGTNMWMSSSFPGAQGGYGSAGFPLLHPQRFLVHGGQLGMGHGQQGPQANLMQDAQPCMQPMMMIPTPSGVTTSLHPGGSNVPMPQHLQQYLGADPLVGFDPLCDDDEGDEGVPDVFYNG